MTLQAGPQTFSPPLAAALPAIAERRPVRLAYLVSHPIQYQAPLLRRIALEPGIDLTVFFGSDFSLRNYADKGFGVAFKWDVPLVDGYKHEFLPAIRDNATVGPFAPISRGIFKRLRGRKGSPPCDGLPFDGLPCDGLPFDVLWVHGYASVNAMHAILAANALGIPVLLRAESTLIDRSRSPLQACNQEALLPHAGQDDRRRTPYRHAQRSVLAVLPGARLSCMALSLRG